MADKIQKFLARLSCKEFELVEALLLDILNDQTSHLDIKPIKGHKNIHRARKGDVRVVFSKIDGVTKILQVGRRSEKTYKDF